jgi:hypothetical protein
MRRRVANQSVSSNMSDDVVRLRQIRSRSSRQRRCSAASEPCARTAARIEPADVPVMTDGSIPTTS